MRTEEALVFLSLLCGAIVSLHITTPILSNVLQIGTGVFGYLLTCSYLAVAAVEKQEKISATTTRSGISEEKPFLVSLNIAIRIQFLGALTSAWIFGLQFTLLHVAQYPLIDCLSRTSCFFYSCKLLDLTLRAHAPPLWHDGAETYAPRHWKDRWKYAWQLLNECRYRSFNIAVVERGRNGPPSKVWIYGPPIVLPVLAYLVPCAETLSLLGLLAISFALETTHTIIHPKCPHPLFWQPFAATSIASFWRIHWHQGAASWLYSLGYVPVKSLVSPVFGPTASRAVGILATFSLSGIWHGWIASALSTTPWRTALGMWALFTCQGLACLLEQAIFGRRQGSMMQRIFCWTCSILPFAAWIRDSRERSKVPWLASPSP